MNQYKALIIGILIGCLITMVRSCAERRMDEIQYNKEKIELKKKINGLLGDIVASKSRVDTIYIQKAEEKRKHEKRIAEIRELSPPEQDSLFIENYPNKDSANLTFEYLRSCREQLVLSDSIIIQKDTQIFALEQVCVIKDKLLNLETMRADNEAKNGKRKARKSFLWGIGIGTISGYVLGKAY